MSLYLSLVVASLFLSLNASCFHCCCRWSTRGNRTIPPSVRSPILFDSHSMISSHFHANENLGFCSLFFSTCRNLGFLFDQCLVTSGVCRFVGCSLNFDFVAVHFLMLFFIFYSSACKARGSDLRVHFKVCWSCVCLFIYSSYCIGLFLSHTHIHLFSWLVYCL